MTPDQPLDLGHSTPQLKQANMPGDQVEHAHCNRKAGGQTT